MLQKTTFYLFSPLMMDLGYFPWFGTTNSAVMNILVHVSIGPLESIIYRNESVASLLGFLILANSYSSMNSPTWSSVRMLSAIDRNFGLLLA